MEFSRHIKKKFDVHDNFHLREKRPEVGMTQLDRNA